MNVCVIGRGHFASIVAVGTAERGHVVMQDDEAPSLLRASQLSPDQEPGYTALAAEMHAERRLVDTLEDVDVYWIAYDVPLDANGAPVTTEIEARIVRLHQRTDIALPFVVSCQWPVGTTAELEAQCPGRCFVYALENVRAGKAVADFQFQPVLVVGARTALSEGLRDLFRSSGEPFVTMSPESAELSKHALNAFMALQIAFVNELADVAADVSADIRDVSRALMSDPRVSPRAPLRAGAPFGGGSLQRDLFVLEGLSDGPILHAIRASNDSRS